MLEKELQCIKQVREQKKSRIEILILGAYDRPDKGQGLEKKLRSLQKYLIEKGYTETKLVKDLDVDMSERAKSKEAMNRCSFIILVIFKGIHDRGGASVEADWILSNQELREKALFCLQGTDINDAEFTTLIKDALQTHENRSIYFSGIEDLGEQTVGRLDTIFQSGFFRFLDL